MSSYDEKSGWEIKASPGSALLNNGIAVTGWNDGDQERVYFIGRDDKIFERRRNGGDWSDGEFPLTYQAAHYSNLAAISFEGTHGARQIRVFFQTTDNFIREVCGDGVGNWKDGETFPAATPATSIACSQAPDRAYYYWLFYQKPDTTFIEYVKEKDTRWQEGTFTSEKVYDPGASITCTSYGTGSHRVFTVNSHNRLCVTEFNSGEDNWSKTRAITRTIPSSPTTTISAIGDPVPVRVYFQVQGSQITEWGTDNDMEDYDVITESVPTQGSG